MSSKKCHCIACCSCTPIHQVTGICPAYRRRHASISSLDNRAHDITNSITVCTTENKRKFLKYSSSFPRTHKQARAYSNNTLQTICCDSTNTDYCEIETNGVSRHSLACVSDVERGECSAAGPPDEKITVSNITSSLSQCNLSTAQSSGVSASSDDVTYGLAVNRSNIARLSPTAFRRKADVCINIFN